MEASDVAIKAEGLVKRYGDTTALERFDLTVETGTVHGLLGPNGAGKTTAVRILTTLLRPDGGHARVAGHDVVRHAEQVRSRIGLVGQHAAVDEVLSGRQNLILFGRLHHLGAAAAVRRADDLLERFGLAETGRKPVSRYSGGMRRRLDLAVGLIHTPRVLFLDEPTTGLDPRARSEVWESVRALAGAGTTVLLTTQYLEEADRLAGRISVIDNGTVVAEDSPDGLKARVGADRIDVVLRHASDLPRALEIIDAEPAASGPAASGPASGTTGAGRRISVPVADRAAALVRLVRALDESAIEIEDLALRRPTLDEVFLRLTGHRAAPSGAGDPARTTDSGDWPSSDLKDVTV